MLVCDQSQYVGSVRTQNLKKKKISNHRFYYSSFAVWWGAIGIEMEVRKQKKY